MQQIFCDIYTVFNTKTDFPQLIFIKSFIDKER
mgnify:CR=1 FL=1